MTFSRFLLAGALNTGLTYVLYLVLVQVTPYPVAYSTTYICGIALGYVLNSKWVFKTEPSARTATYYPLSYGVNYIFGISMVWFFVEVVHIPKEIAPLLTLVISVPLMYRLTRAIFRGAKST